MNRKSRRDVIIDVYDREAMGEVSADEITFIIEQLVVEFGKGGALEPAEVARILVDEGLPVKLDEVFGMPSTDEEYEHAFEDVLDLSGLKEAEKSIRRLDSLYRDFRDRNDEKGMMLARKVALGGKVSASENVDSGDEKAEIVEWITVWLQTPDIFDDWLVLRKHSADFRNRFGTLYHLQPESSA